MYIYTHIYIYVCVYIYIMRFPSRYSNVPIDDPFSIAQWSFTSSTHNAMSVHRLRLGLFSKDVEGGSNPI